MPVRLAHVCFEWESGHDADVSACPLLNQGEHRYGENRLHLLPGAWNCERGPILILAVSLLRSRIEREASCRADEQEKRSAENGEVLIELPLLHAACRRFGKLPIAV